MTKRDYYEILGVSRNATKEEIKQAYKRLARKYHPDLHPGDKKMEEKFKEINEAYQVLSDDEKRKQYDMFGHAGMGNYGTQGTGGWDTGNFGFDFKVDGIDFDFGDIFDSIFRRKHTTSKERGFGGFYTGFKPRGQDLHSEMEITLRESLAGTKKLISLDRGTGKIEHIEVSVPKGIKDGQTIRLRGKGAPGPGGSGDLYIKIKVKEEAGIYRKGNNIYVDFPIKLTESIKGATLAFTSPLGDNIEVKIPPGVKSGQKLRLRKKGIPPDGDLYLNILIHPPKIDDRELLKKIEMLEKKQGLNPRR